MVQLSVGASLKTSPRGILKQLQCTLALILQISCTLIDELTQFLKKMFLLIWYFDGGC